MRRFFGLCALIMALGATQAAGVPAPPARPFLVRVNGPCPKKCQWIAVQGAIDKTTLEGFNALVATLDGAKPPVFFNSVGGDVAAAVLMGERIRALGLDTAIAATRVHPKDVGILGESPKDAPRGDVVISQRGFCASACSFAFAGGVRRYAPLETSLGLHQMLQPEQDVKQKVAVIEQRTVTVDGRVVAAPRLVGTKIVERHLRKGAPPSPSTPPSKPISRRWASTEGKPSRSCARRRPRRWTGSRRSRFCSSDSRQTASAPMRCWTSDLLCSVRRAPQTVADRFAQALAGDRGDGGARDPAGVERAQMRE